MNYNIIIKPSAKKELLELPDEILQKVDNVIIGFQEQPRPQGVVKLKGWDFYRIRVGNYRIVYSIDDKRKVVEISRIGHRKDIYR